MIDLRSDTLTKPTQDMYYAIMSADLGDASRPKTGERCGDPTADALELEAARMMGTEDAAFVCSGTMGNSCALLAAARPGDSALIEETLHVWSPERTAFSDRIGRLVSVIYDCTDDGLPDPASIDRELSRTGAKLVCVENSHNARGGICIPLALQAEITKVARRHGAHVHMDGARVFNAADALGVEPAKIVEQVDSVMFCVSKGPGAPFGSLVCGSAEFMQEVREVRHLLGGGLRQSGVVAAPAMIALERAMERAHEDNARAKRMAAMLAGLEHTQVQQDVQTNIMMLRPKDIHRDEYIKKLEEHGLLLSRSGDSEARMVFHREIGDCEAEEAAAIIKKVDAEMTRH